MRRLVLLAAMAVGLAALAARPHSELQAILALNGTPSAPAVTLATYGGAGTLGAAAAGDVVRFQCDNAARYAVGATPDAGNGEYVAAKDVRVFFLPEPSAVSVYVQPSAGEGDGGLTCLRWVLR